MSEASEYMARISVELERLHDRVLELLALDVGEEETFELWSHRLRNFATVMEEMMPVSAMVREARRAYGDQYDPASLNRLEHRIDNLYSILPSFIRLTASGMARTR